MKKPRKRGRVHRSQQNGVFARVAVVRLIEKEIVETEEVLTSFTRLNKVKILCTSEDGSLWLNKLQKRLEWTMWRREVRRRCGIVSKLDDCDVNKIISPVRLICDAMGFYHLEVFLVLKEKGHFKSEDYARNLILKLLGPNSNFVVCGGIVDFDESGNRLGYDPKHLRKWEMPFKRVDSDMCELLHEPKNRARKEATCRRCSI